MTDLYARIKKANSEIKTMDLRGNDYPQVHERVKAFRKVYPSGTITTEIEQNDDHIIVMCAEVSNDQGEVLATGHAFEIKNSTNVNKTSWLENCETSAVGRALSLAGFGIDAGIASAEELEGALKEQERIEAEEDRKKTEEVKNLKIGAVKSMALEDALERVDISVDKICERCGVKHLKDITEEQFKAVNEIIKNREKEQKKKEKA